MKLKQKTKNVAQQEDAKQREPGRHLTATVTSESGSVDKEDNVAVSDMVPVLIAAPGMCGYRCTREIHEDALS